jgi:formylmethanofuran dehydrogenase subunit E
MLKGYQIIPDEDLFRVQAVSLDIPLSDLISRPGRKSECAQCGEEIINGREISREKLILCRACAGETYFHVLDGTDIRTDNKTLDFTR